MSDEAFNILKNVAQRVKLDVALSPDAGATLRGMSERRGQEGALRARALETGLAAGPISDEEFRQLALNLKPTRQRPAPVERDILQDPPRGFESIPPEAGQPLSLESFGASDLPAVPPAAAGEAQVMTPRELKEFRETQGSRVRAQLAHDVQVLSSAADRYDVEVDRFNSIVSSPGFPGKVRPLPEGLAAAAVGRITSDPKFSAQSEARRIQLIGRLLESVGSAASFISQLNTQIQTAPISDRARASQDRLFGLIPRSPEALEQMFREAMIGRARRFPSLGATGEPTPRQR